MTEMQHYVVPAQTLNPTGQTRRVGFELEFSGIELLQVVALAADALQARSEVHNQAEATLSTGLGDFIIEVDSELAKTLAQRWEATREGGLESDHIGKWAVNLTTELVPVEVVCPPIALDQLHELNPLVDTLRSNGALGTSGSLLYAFGLHINPELADLSPQHLVAYLKAYVIAQDWLVRKHKVDFTRRLTPYIDLYPAAYIQRVLNYDEAVSQQQLIDDYLSHNATRNRALDLLPLLKHLDEQQIRDRIPDSRIKARPTFHYRLPNCEIDRKDWNLARSWNIWCVLEALVENEPLLARLVAQYQAYDPPLVAPTEKPWFSELDDLHAALVSG